MSRYYLMYFVVSEVAEQDLEKLHGVIDTEWRSEFPWHNKQTKKFTTNGENALSGGTTPEDFAQLIAEKIWAELGRFVEVMVSATLLEDLPHDTYIMEKSAYGKWKRKEKRNAKDHSAEGSGVKDDAGGR